MAPGTPRKVLYIQYNNPAALPPLEHSSLLLAESGWEVLFLGIGSLGAADNLRLPTHPRIRVLQLSFCKPGWRQKLHYLKFCLWVLAHTLRWQPTWIYASDLFSCPIALLLSTFPGVRVVYHEHDSPEGVGLLLRVCLAARTRVARSSKICVLPNLQRAELFQDETKSERVSVVWNCPSRTGAEIEHPERSDQDFWLLYHGSIVPERLPTSIVEALTLLPNKVKLRVIGYETIGSAGYLAELMRFAHQLGVSERIEIRGAVPTRKELLHWCRQSDIGLSLVPMTGGDRNMRTMAGASNKPFDYLACGNPLLISNLPNWRSLFEEPGYAKTCDPSRPESIAESLQWFVDHPNETHEMGEQGRRRILSEWHYERQFAEVYNVLESQPGKRSKTSNSKEVLSPGIVKETTDSL